MVKRRTGFTVEYGPVRAEDLPAYMEGGKATPEMRQVRFNMRDRAVLVPVEMKNYLLWTVLAGFLATVLLGWEGLAAVAVLFLTGTVLFPLLLPFLPFKAFSAKGFFLGAVVAVLFALTLVWAEGGSLDPSTVLTAVAWALLISPWVAYLALNFTGSSTLTSRTGVRKEIFRYIPLMAVTFIIGAVLMLVYRLDVGGWF